MIRLYEERDMKVIIDVWYQASLIAHPFLTETFLKEEKNKLREIFLPNSQTWVYEEDSQVVGFISLMGSEVGGIFVRPSKQRQGVGKALMDKACSLYETLELDVFEANELGRAFYAKYGFVPIRKYKEERTGERVIRLRYKPEKRQAKKKGRSEEGKEIMVVDTPLRGQIEILAYRGGAAERPENTMEAFSHAVGLSSDIIIDIDLQFAKDQTVVVIHDDTLDRTTNGSGIVSDYSILELKQLDAGYHFLDASGEPSFRGKGVTIPTLEEIFVEYPETRFILDIRRNDPKHIERVIEVVESASAIGRVIVVSELDEVINKCRDLRADWTYGAPTNEARAVIFGSQKPVSPVFMIPESHDGVQVLSAELITKLHKHGTRIWIWTIDKPDAFLRLKEEGVDGIFTNVPEAMINQLNRWQF